MSVESKLSVSEMGSKSLLKCLPGSGLNKLIQQFEEIYKQDPFSTYLIVPTSRLRKEILHQFDKNNTPVIANNIITLKDFTQKIFSDHNKNNILISPEESELIISQILHQNSSNFPLFFHKEVPSSRMIRELKKFISTLINRKVNYPECLKDLKSSKSDQLELVFNEYIKYLKENNLVDEDLLLHWVIQQLTGSNINSFNNVFIYGFYEPLPLEKDLIKSIADNSGNFYYAIPFGDNKAIFIDDGQWLGIKNIQENIPEDQAYQISNIFSDIPKSDLSKWLFISSKRDRLLEVRTIAQAIRNLIARGADPRKIAVAFPDLNKGAAFVNEVFPDHGIPFDVAIHDDLAQSPIIQTIFDMLKVPALNYKRTHLVGLLKSPYIRFQYKHEGKKKRLLPNEVDFESLAANIIEGSNNWLPGFEALIGELKSEIESPDTPEPKRNSLGNRVKRIEKLLKGITELFNDIKTLEGKKTIGDHIKKLRCLLSKWDFQKLTDYHEEEIYERDSKALSSFFNLLDSMELSFLVIPTKKIDLNEFLTTLSLLTQEKKYRKERENRNKVQITGLREIVHLTFDYLFIADMVDGEIPRVSLSQPFTSDLEVERMGLLTKKDLLRQERYYFLAALLVAGKRVYLIYPQSERDKPLVFSSFIDSITKCFEYNTWGEIENTTSILLTQFNEGKKLAQGELDYAMITNTSPLKVSNILEKINIENFYRKKDYNSKYDGVLENDNGIVEEMTLKFDDSKIYSPTMFEMFGLCPFRYYLKNILYLDVMPRINTEITPQERGSLFHRIVFRFYNERKEKGFTKVTESDQKEALQHIKTIAHEEFNKFYYDDPVWTAFKQKYLGDDILRQGLLETFIKKEIEDIPPDFSPAYFELSIGNPIKPGCVDKYSTEDPVILDLGDGDPGTVSIRGKIDRLDITGNNKFMIIDYKTGKKDHSFKDVKSGLAFQLPLYILSVENLNTEIDGIAGAYYFVKNPFEINKWIQIGDKTYKDMFGSLGKVNGIRDDFGVMLLGSLNHIKKYIKLMRRGMFHPSVHFGKCPDYCEYKTICRFNDLRLFEFEGSELDESN